MGVKFGNFHSKDDYGMDFLTYSISSPKPKQNLIDVPLRDGTIDLTTALTDEVMYENRTITASFEVRDKRALWSSKISNIRNDLHGRRLKIVFDDDPNFYYIGRVFVGEITSNGSTGTLVIEADAEPYKYDMFSSDEDWEWDTFDFENGIINEAAEIVVNGATSFTLICRRKRMFPTLTVSGNVSLVFDGVVHKLPSGASKVYDIFLNEGENIIELMGNGVVSIAYRGGSL